MSHCAICTSSRGPFTSQPLGKNNALVSVCAECDEPAFEKRGPERGYEPTGGLPTFAQGRNAVARVIGRQADSRPSRTADEARRRPHGWSVYRIRQKAGLDAREAYETLRGKPWFGPGRVKFGGTDANYLLFYYAPDAKLALPEDNPLAAIEQFRTVP